MPNLLYLEEFRLLGVEISIAENTQVSSLGEQKMVMATTETLAPS